MFTVNMTCTICDGRRLCAACRAVARTMRAAGYEVVHSSRYEALRAAAAGTYGFDACIIPIAAREEAVLNAAGALMESKRVALIVDGDSPPVASLPQRFSVLKRSEYEAGILPTQWLGATNSMQGPGEGPTVDDRALATRRLMAFVKAANSSGGRMSDEATSPPDLIAALDDEITWAQVANIGFSIVYVHVGRPSRHNRQGAEPDHQARPALLSATAGGVRRADTIAVRNDEILIILHEVDAQGAAHVVARVSNALAKAALDGAPSSAKRRGTNLVRIAAATFGQDGTSREALLACAMSRLRPIGES